MKWILLFFYGILISIGVVAAFGGFLDILSRLGWGINPLLILINTLFLIGFAFFSFREALKEKRKQGTKPPTKECGNESRNNKYESYDSNDSNRQG